MVTRHLLDSLVILPYLHGNKILDVGTGAGLPGIPLAIAAPEKEFVLLDSNSKKTRFVNQVVSELGLENVSVVHSRIEQFQNADGFDTITARAFATLDDLIHQSEHLCVADASGEKKCHYLIMKGAYPVAEIDNMPAGYEITQSLALQVPDLDAERHILIVSKA